MLIWILLIVAAVLLTFTITTIRNNRRIKILTAAFEVVLQETQSSWFHAGWEEGRDYERRQIERDRNIARLS